MERMVYNHSAYPFFLSTYELAHPQQGLWAKLAAIEERVFQQTSAHKILWHQSPNYSRDMLHYQRSTAAELGRLLRY